MSKISLPLQFTYRNDPLENQVISEFRWVRIKRKSGSILLDNQQLGYLYRVTSPRMEDVADEMLAILSDRNAIMEKKASEHAQATLNDVYERGL